MRCITSMCKLAKHVGSNLFIDMAFAYPLISRSDWLHVLEKQAEVFTSIGDIGKNTVTYRRYKSEVRSYVTNMLRSIYEKTTIEKKLKEDLVEDKAERAWKALITWYATLNLMKKIGLGLGELLPNINLASVAPIIKSIIEEKTRSKNTANMTVVKKALTQLGISGRELCDKVAVLWWIIPVMESKVLKTLPMHKDEDELLLHLYTTYMVEIQKLAGIEKPIQDISLVIVPRKGSYSGASFALANLILFSPIFIQYSIEVHSTVSVTPADIIVATLRLINNQPNLQNFVISVQEVAKEIIEFWKESDILRRLKAHIRSDITPDTVYKSRLFTTSLAFLIYSGVEGIHISTMRTPILKLPPRMIGFDSLFIHPQCILPIVRKVWTSRVRAHIQEVR